MPCRRPFARGVTKVVRYMTTGEIMDHRMLE
jgi:hypothetical protein